jgi:carboxyl-terminal processing protease
MYLVIYKSATNHTVKVNRLFRVKLKTCSLSQKVGMRALSLSVLVFSSMLALAQAPLYLSADIPLDVNTIYQELQPSDDYAQTTKSIIEQLRRNHYSEIVFDDRLAGTVLDSYLKTLDAGRLYFTQDDINEFEKYRTELDDLLVKGDVEVGYLIYNHYQHRLIERFVYSINQIEDPSYVFDFTQDETLQLDRKQAPWAADQNELQELWRKQVKSNVLSLKLADKTVDEARELLGKRYRSQLSQVLKTNGLDVYQSYMNAMTLSFDPHTQYFAPRAAENFNMNMRLSLEGIGATLTTEDEYTKVVSIVTGGPAESTGQLHPSDKILGVAQGDEPFVDVIGWRVDDVVQLVRGEKGSVVRLNVMPAGASLETKVISITRDTVKLEDSAAKSEIVEVEYEGKTHKIGVIELPTFYADFDAMQRRDPNYRSTTKDVQTLLEKLKTEGVEGVVLDLRNNGGGALNEANSLVGLFIRRGPAVQVRDAEGNIIVQGDPDPEIIYDGPLAVLVNRLSASATEIFAGAIQDYQRGIVMGSQTFGKGTVQEIVSMDEGQMNITIAKFYRISGESTQHKGVTPDILFPDLFDASDDIGESALPTALPWDTIEPNFYRSYSELRPLIPELASSHDLRLATDPDFVFIRSQINHALESRNTSDITLNEEKLLTERAEDAMWRLNAENRRREKKGLPLLNDISDVDASLETEAGEEAQSSDELNKQDSLVVNEKIEEESDPYLIEGGKVLLDLINLQAEA